MGAHEHVDSGESAFDQRYLLALADQFNGPQLEGTVMIPLPVDTKTTISLQEVAFSLAVIEEAAATLQAHTDDYVDQGLIQ